MIRTVVIFCTNNPAPTAGILPFALAKGSAATKLALVDGYTAIALGKSGGVTLDTTALRKAMTDLSFQCGSAITAYASSVNNNTLKAIVNFTQSDYVRFKKDEVDDTCQAVHDAAHDNLVAAGPFGYVAGDVTDLQSAIDLYRASTQNPRNFIITRANANKQVPIIIRDIIDNVFVGQMDKMVNTLKKTQPDFHSKYFFAREIIDLGSTTGKVRGTVTDNQDNTMNGVRFTIFKTGTTQVVGTTLTANGGTFNVANLLPADYDFVWEFTGFQTVRENVVHLSAGKELKRKIKMLPV